MFETDDLILNSHNQNYIMKNVIDKALSDIIENKK